MKTAVKVISTVIISFVAVSSCNNFDDTKLWEAINANTARIVSLEEAVRSLNTETSNLRKLIEALQKNDMVTNVSELADGTGYTISFTSGKSIVIKHGKDGQDGNDGKDGNDGHDGNDGDDGYSPKIGVAKDTDNIYYWTLDGTWLLDDSGNKIPVSGKDGKDGNDGTNGTDGEDGDDGITPIFKIEEDYWYVSYNNGESWTQLGRATGNNGLPGKDGDTTIKSVDVEDGYVKFVLNDGNDTVIKLAFVKETKVLTITLKQAGTIGQYVTVKDAAGVDKLICSGPINADDINFIYSYFYNTGEIDLSQCTYTGYTYSMESGGENIRNPYQERLLEKLSLPKDLVVFSGLFPYLQEVLVQTTRCSYTKYNGTVVNIDMKIPVAKYNTYNYSGSEATQHFAKIKKMEIAEGAVGIYEYISPNTDYPQDVLCDTLVLPSTIRGVANTLFFVPYNSGGTSSVWTYKEITNIVCKAVTPPQIWTSSIPRTEPNFYLTTLQTNYGTGYTTGSISNSLFVPAESVELYRAADGWSQFQTILPIPD